MLADGLTQPAGAVAVHHPDLFPGGQESAVDVGVQLLQGRLDPLADQVDLGRRRGGRPALVRPAPLTATNGSGRRRCRPLQLPRYGWPCPVTVVAMVYLTNP